jgi:hypothetical protein
VSTPDLSPESPPQGAETAAFDSAIPFEEVEAQLQRILQSAVFRNAPRHSRFLEFTVQKTLAGKGEEIKEYVVGLEVFDQPSEFDPRSDPVVRAEARRLRSRLADYYKTIGEFDPVQVDLPKGTYVPVFARRNGHAISPSPEAPSEAEKSSLLPDNVEDAPRNISPNLPAAASDRWWWLAFASVLTVVVSLLAGYAIFRHRAASTWLSDASNAPAAKVRRSVAVLGFSNLSGSPDAAWLSTALAEMMTTELGAGGKLLTIPD